MGDARNYGGRRALRSYADDPGGGRIRPCPSDGDGDKPGAYVACWKINLYRRGKLPDVDASLLDLLSHSNRSARGTGSDAHGAAYVIQRLGALGCNGA